MGKYDQLKALFSAEAEKELAARKKRKMDKLAKLGKSKAVQKQDLEDMKYQGSKAIQNEDMED